MPKVRGQARKRHKRNQVAHGLRTQRPDVYSSSPGPTEIQGMTAGKQRHDDCPYHPKARFA